LSPAKHMQFMREVWLILALFMGSFTAKGQVEVAFFISPTCKICQFYALEMQQLEVDYGSRVEFKAYAVGPLLTDSMVAEFKRTYGIPFPVERDDSLHRQWNATITPEVFVMHNAEVVYHGRIDDSFVRVGKRRAHVKNRELRSALERILQGKTVDVPFVPAVGCIIEK